jgi:hypothetical protein
LPTEEDTPRNLSPEVCNDVLFDPDSDFVNVSLAQLWAGFNGDKSCAFVAER